MNHRAAKQGGKKKKRNVDEKKEWERFSTSHHLFLHDCLAPPFPFSLGKKELVDFCLCRLSRTRQFALILLQFKHIMLFYYRVVYLRTINMAEDSNFDLLANAEKDNDNVPYIMSILNCQSIDEDGCILVIEEDVEQGKEQ